MRSLSRRKIDAAVRARDVCRAHPFEDPAHVTIMAALDDRVATAEQLALEEEIGRRTTAGAARVRRAIREKLYHQFRIVSRTAALAARDSPELAAALPMPGSDLGAGPMVTRGWALHAAAKANLETLARHGLAATTLEDLAVLLTRFEAELERSTAGRLGHLGTRAQLDRVIAEIGDLVDLLDAINVHRFRRDAKSLWAWTNARDVVKSPTGEPAAGQPGDPATSTGSASGRGTAA